MEFRDRQFVKILSIYRYYWPDTTPYARILQSILEKWVKDGHAVTVYTGQPGYNDIRHKKQPWRKSHNGVKIIRVPLLPERKKIQVSRFINFLIFLARGVLHALFKNKYDLLIINSFPPVLMGLTARLINKITKIPYTYHCQDIHPESALIAGNIDSGWLYNILKKIDAENCKKAKIVITLSEDMADTLVRRGLSRKNIHVLNNFIVDFNNSLKGIPSQPIRKTEDELHVLFAGNIGNFQGVDSVIEAAKLLKCKKQIHFNFMGEGLAKDNLMRQSGELLGETVFFMPYQPIEIAFAAMQDADLGLISLKPNVYKVAFPSKTMMYLAAGCPLLAIVEKESELAKEIVSKNMGYVCSPNPVEIAETINRAWTERETLKKNRERIGNMAQEVFGRDVILDEWSKIVKFLW